ncbi:Arm DNA-binding domain-containing protein [Pseudomonas nitroreducens]|uniref:Arm DNA-binding domain-containing protein n=1 Tax=Pseudomonas TaxID=286 RepID=UPI000A30ADE5|nr:Arm DNA-binding domain-containing protein [Pseudomonas nitroreducens]
MARPITPLSDSKCEAPKSREKAYKLADGQGLYLFVRLNGSKLWQMKYTRPNGSENMLTFGEYGRQGRFCLSPPSALGRFSLSI